MTLINVFIPDHNWIESEEIDLDLAASKVSLLCKVLREKHPESADRLYCVREGTVPLPAKLNDPVVEIRQALRSKDLDVVHPVKKLSVLLPNPNEEHVHFISVGEKIPTLNLVDRTSGTNSAKDSVSRDASIRSIIPAEFRDSRDLKVYMAGRSSIAYSHPLTIQQPKKSIEVDDMPILSPDDLEEVFPGKQIRTFYPWESSPTLAYFVFEATPNSQEKFKASRLETVHEEEDAGKARESIARKVMLEADSPSKGAKSPTVMNRQKIGAAAAAYNCRPLELQPPSLGIYHPVFAKFRRRLTTPLHSLTFSKEELKEAQTLIWIALSHYPDEATLRSTLKEAHLFRPMFWTEKQISIGSTYFVPDGSDLASVNNVAECLTSIAEVKTFNTDVDPSEQAMLGYRKYTSSDQRKGLRSVSCCPIFLVALRGEDLWIWGAVFADSHFFERLAVLNIGPKPTRADDTIPNGRRTDYATGVRDVAMVLRALGEGLEELHAYYGRLEVPPIPSTPQASKASSRNRRAIPPTSPQRSPPHMPHWNSFCSQGPNQETYTLTYKRRIVKGFHRTVFEAEMRSESDPTVRHVVVKFSETYDDVGHRHIASLGTAPNLHYAEFLGETVGLWVVVMDFVRGQHNVRMTKKQAAKLRLAITSLHEIDHAFGDLRGENVVVSDDGDTINLIDFEFGGVCVDTVGDAGEVAARRVRYPTDVNMEHDWAEGVGPDMLIQKEHDLYRLGKILSEFADQD